MTLKRPSGRETVALGRQTWEREKQKTFFQLSFHGGIRLEGSRTEALSAGPHQKSQVSITYDSHASELNILSRDAHQHLIQEWQDPPAHLRRPRKVSI